MRIDECALYVLIEGIVLMARLNITLPDVLYARLEQLRDRINLSKVCATALEKEVTMLEGQPPITDPRIAQLLQRLQSTRERWYQRGHEDGIQWAVDLATRDELQSVATHLAEQDGRQLAEFFQMRDKLTVTTHFAPPPSPPHVLHLQPPMSAGQRSPRTTLQTTSPPAKSAYQKPSASQQRFLHCAGNPFTRLTEHV